MIEPGKCYKWEGHEVYYKVLSKTQFSTFFEVLRLEWRGLTPLRKEQLEIGLDEKQLELISEWQFNLILDFAEKLKGGEKLIKQAEGM